MRHSLLPTTAMVWAIAQSAAFAAPASQTYADVPAGHWAEAAVTQVGVDRRFMQGFPDGTFRGNAPFTRLQLALAVSELIKELEALSKTSWVTQGLGGYAFQDLPGDAETQAIVLRMANDYRLFEGVPGVTSQTLEADKQVTRYEMAKVVHRLMRLGEEKGLVDPTVQRTQLLLFSDVPAGAWAYNEVKEVSERYQVMVGFPDATFRGPEELTRYQFAAAAAQTFPMVRTLVEKTQERKDQPEAVTQAGALRFQERAALALGLTGRFDGPIGPGLNARYAHYFGPLFLLADANLATQLAAGTRLYNGAVSVGYAIPVGDIAHFQPYLGGRAVSTGTETLGGLTYGAVAYARPLDAWGFFLNANGTSALGGTRANLLGGFSGSATLGAEFYLNDKLGLTAELGYGLLPNSLGLPTAAYGTEGALLGTVGLLVGF